MGYTNSPLVVYTNLSPNHSGQRTHSIDRITPHCVVGQLSAESICGCFTSTSRQASCNYGIGTDGRVSLCVEEKNRSWCSSSNANDQRAITIECASDMNEPYAMNSAVYNSLVKLCIDICKRNGKKKLLWLGDKNKTLNYAPAADEMVLTVHRWFANKSCPGNWLYARLGDLAAKVTTALGGSSGLQASSLKNLSEADAVAKIGPLFTANQKTTGILACVSMAQFILESGYRKQRSKIPFSRNRKREKRHLSWMFQLCWQQPLNRKKLWQESARVRKLPRLPFYPRLTRNRTGLLNKNQKK